jgi:elongation factor Ts
MSIKELREKTGAGLMACRKALSESGDDIEKAIVLLKEQGVIKAEKRGGRVASDGQIGVQSSGVHQAAMVEINSETDFVARGDDFRGFVDAVLEAALANKTEKLEELLDAKLKDGVTVEERRQAMVAQIGENIQVRRVCFYGGNGFVTHYLHGSKIGVLVMLSQENDALGRDLAMHIAAINPAAIDESSLDPAIIEAERQIYKVQAAESGKSGTIQDKIVEGRVQRFVKERTLLGQPFVKNPDQSIADLLKINGNIKVLAFTRFELGENQAIVKEDFAEEVSKMLGA